MALGGYKFVGYHYSVPAGYDSSDPAQVKAQCLVQFKCRLRAFVDSCAASGAQWEFCETQGNESFGSYGDVIYRLDSDGYNYGSFFKYKDKEWYMSLVTYKIGGTSAAFLYSYQSASNSFQYDTGGTCSRCGCNRINASNWNSIINGVLMNRSGENFSSNPSTLTPGVSNICYGFATKGCDVISMVKSSPSSVPFSFKVMSPDAFSSLCSPSDGFPALDVNLSKNVYVYGSNVNTMTDSGLVKRACQCLRSDGTKFIPSYYGSTFCIYPEKDGAYTSPIDNVPYVSPLITTNVDQFRPDSSCIPNADGILSKGRVKVDLLAINSPTQSSEVGAYRMLSPYANGNYLLFTTMFYTSGQSSTTPTSYPFCNAFLYCGWDPSNPDIMQASAWTEYTEE